MLNSKNSLNLNPNKNTFTKSVYSRPQVDSLVKKERKIIETINYSDKKDTVITQKVFLENSTTDINSIKQNTDVAGSSMDNNKRLFLKVAGVAGLGLAASALFPKSADAYVSGSTPTSNVVGVKNVANTKINPSTEEKQDAILTELQLKANLNETQPVSVAGTVNVGISGASNTIGINNEAGTRITPTQDDTVILLRRMVKMMESQAVVDANMRQRVTVDIMPTTAVTLASTTITQLAGVDSRWQIIDWAKQAYNSGIRYHLLNS